MPTFWCRWGTVIVNSPKFVGTLPPVEPLVSTAGGAHVVLETPPELFSYSIVIVVLVVFPIYEATTTSVKAPIPEDSASSCDAVGAVYTPVV